MDKVFQNDSCVGSLGVIGYRFKESRMQVTCEHCSAEYDLDPGEITGRGVRITCPSCAHVFIVYQQETPQESSGNDGIDIEIDLDDKGELDIDIDFDAMFDEVLSGVEETPSENKPEDSPSTIPVEVAMQKDEEQDDFFSPEPSSVQDNHKNQSGGAVNEPSHSSVQESVGTSDDTAQGIDVITDEQVASLDVHSLNFASVGIKSWKVKKSIGLMFEYSDYKTFQKSRNDGRISEADQISPDGENWVSMAEIADFEAYFCRTYLEFKKKGFTPEKKEVKERVIQPLGGTNELASALAAAQAEVEQANSSPKVASRRGTQGQGKRSQRNKTKSGSGASTSNNKSSSGLVLNLLIGIAVVGGVWYLFSGSSNQATSTSVTETSTNLDSKAVTAKQDDDAELEKLRAELQKSAAQIEAQQEPEPEPSAEEEPQLMVKVPDEVLAQQRALAEGKVASVPKPKQVDHVKAGQQALQAGQWSGAITSFQQAYRNNPKPEYLSSIGFAQFKMGQFSPAKQTLKEAIKKGSVSANKWLGYLLRDEGDIAGSNQYLNQYLQNNPSDAAEVKRRMMQ